MFLDYCVQNVKMSEPAKRARIILVKLTSKKPFDAKSHDFSLHFKFHDFSMHGFFSAIFHVFQSMWEPCSIITIGNLRH